MWILISNIYALGVLIAASYTDWRYREVEPLYWYVTAKIGVPLGILALIEYHGVLDLKALLPLIIANLVGILVIAGMYAVGLMGGADLAAVAFVALSSPIAGLTGSKAPAALLGVLYASVLQASALPVAICMYNKLRGTSPGGVRCFFAVKEPASKAITRRWWFPVSERGLPSFAIDSWPHEELAAKLELEGPDTSVQVSPGIPFLIFYAIGFLIVVIIGQKPLEALLGWV